MTNNFVYLALGAFLGAFCTLLIAPDIPATFDLESTATLFISIVVAASAVKATKIHADSVKQQKTSRYWELNKEVVLDLIEKLALVETANRMSYNLISAQNAWYGPDEPPEVDPADYLFDKEAWSKLDKSIDKFLAVYSFLMPSSLTNEISNYQAENQKVESWVNNDGLDADHAYNHMGVTAEQIRTKIISIAQKMAGVDDYLT